ncbi:MAG: ABC transporter substrate-binding protein [Oscillospiraceae bacterium]|nr:ABC transporter substrate-binding protein [Oscillospiraceae bacterium]
MKIFKKTTSFMLSLFLLFTVFFCGCFNKSNENGGTEKKDSKSETLTIAMTAEPRTLNVPKMEDSTSSFINYNVFETLVDYDKDLKLRPRLATRWAVSEDGLVYTFDLREGVSFSDGTSFNAEAVKKNAERMLANKEECAFCEVIFEGLKKITVDGEHKISFHLDKKCAFFVKKMAICAFSIVSPKSFEGKDINDTNLKQSGTGPYTLAQTGTGFVKLISRENYWGGKPLIKTLIFKSMPESTSREVALKNNEVDIIEGVDVNSIEKLEKEFTVKKTVCVSSHYIALNCDNIENPEIRKAIFQMINIPEMVKTISKGTTPHIKQFLPEIIIPFSNVIKYPEFNLENAKDASEAIKKLKKELKILAVSSSGSFGGGRVLAEKVQAYLEAAGIKTKIELVDWKTYQTKTKGEGRDFDICFGGWICDFMDPHNFYSIFSEKNMDLNYPGFKNAKFEELLEKGVTTFDENERKDIYSNAEDVLATECPILPLYSAPAFAAFSKNVKDFVTTPTGSCDFYKVSKTKD